MNIIPWGYSKYLLSNNPQVFWFSSGSHGPCTSGMFDNVWWRSEIRAISRLSMMQWFRGTKFHLGYARSLGSEDTTNIPWKTFFLTRLDLVVKRILNFRQFFFVVVVLSNLGSYNDVSGWIFSQKTRARRSASRKWLNPKAMPSITAWQPQVDLDIKPNFCMIKMVANGGASFGHTGMAPIYVGKVVLISIDFRISC